MKQITDNKEEILINGAKEFIEIMKTPAEAMDIITYALHYVHEYQMKEEKFDYYRDPHFIIIFILREVVKPWMIGGLEMEKEMAYGIESVYHQCGNEGFQEHLVLLLTASIHEWGEPSEHDFTCMQALRSIGETLIKFNYALEKKETA